MMFKKLTAIFLSLGLMAAVTSCEYVKEHETAQGALIGTAAGAGLGALAGSQGGNAGKGALIGAGVGAALGTGIGYALERQRKHFERELANTNARVEQIEYQGAYAPAGGTQAIQMSFPGSVLFAHDSATLTPQAQASITDVANVITSNQYEIPSRVVVTGHTSRTGDEQYNMQLSQRRAQAVATQLTAQGVPPQVIVAQGAGWNAPDPRFNPADPQQRRVEVLVVP